MESGMKPKDAGIRKAYEVLKEARAGVAQAQYRAIRYCKHKEIGQCKPKLSDYGASDPDERVCLRCGLREVGWGIGYIVLKSEHPASLSRTDAQSISTVTLYEPDKSLINREESSLYDVVRAKLDLPVLKQTAARRAAKKKALEATWAKHRQ
jgi:hypothetical protein